MRYDLPFTDHIEDVDWCLEPAEMIARLWSDYLEEPSSVKMKENIDTTLVLISRIQRNFKPPLSVQIEGEDG